jgi:hypothetical protein
VEAGQTIEAVRDRFAVKHDAGGGEGAHGIGHRHEVTRPVTAVARKVHPLIADVQASGANSLRQIAAKLNQRGIPTAQGETGAGAGVTRERSERAA